MTKQGDKFGDALLSIIDTAEQNGVSYAEIIEQLESYIEIVKEWKQERDAKDQR
jgi:hypothetical protein